MTPGLPPPRGPRKIPRSEFYNRHRKRASQFVFEKFRIPPQLQRLAFVLAVFGVLGIAYFLHNLPDIRTLEGMKKEQGITVETADGKILATYGDVYGTYIPYEKLPKPLIEAVIATEDRRFFVHHGVDFFGIARAMFQNFIHGHVVQGGSTITQQVAKNVFLTPRRSILRKLEEVLLAFWMEAKYTKQEIMAIYLNRVYLGAGTYGIDAASHRYFNKPATDLNLVESAMIAGLLKAPSHFSPTSNVARAKERAGVVLANMVDAGFINDKEAKAALASFNKADLHSIEGNAMRYFTDWVVDDLQNYITGIDEDLVVTTTLDPTLETNAQDALENVMAMEGKSKKVSQAALVAMTPDGAVKAMVGGVSYGESQYNRATQAKRQPGSSFKLFVYLTALESGYTPMTTVLDAPITISQVGTMVWNPENFEGDYKGEIPLYEALRHSLNTVSVRITQTVGADRVAATAMRLGIPNVPAYASIALGTVEATLLEMTSAYAHLPNHGNKVVPYGILEVKTTKGEEVYKREEPAPEQLLSNSEIEMMNYMLMDVVRHGTGVRAALPGREAAGKTGTSSDYKDAWFIGFTPQLVTGVWIGNDNNLPMAKVTGGSIPAGIWHDFMVKAMQGKPAEEIPNSTTGGGFLPWLFGSTNQAPSDQTPVTTPGEEAPPFGFTPPPNGTASAPVPGEMVNGVVVPNNSAPPPMPGQGDVINGAPRQAPAEQPLPWQGAPQPGAPMAPPPPPTEPSAQNGTVLSTEFWKKLANKVPVKIEKPKVEYVYPGENRRGH